MAIREIGCCGAYCKTCMKQQKEKYPNERTCQGCKLGYEEDKRDLSKAKCEIKICCFKERRLETCADCPDFPCEVIKEFWSKKGWKYKQYRKQLEFIRQYGYGEFLNGADEWKGPFGKLKIG
jgi:Protein of unknown function (DUF3795)